MVQYVGRNLTGGVSLGQAGGKASCYGKTPVSQQTVTAVTDGSGGTAAATNGIQPLTGTYNSTLLINAIATLADAIERQRTALVNFGIVA